MAANTGKSPTKKASEGQKKRTGGGKATNTGVPFQAKVSAWIACHALANKPLRHVFGGAVDAVPVSLKHELGSGVDDAQVRLEPKGRLFLQITTAPTVGKVKSFLEQAVDTWNSSKAGGSDDEYTPRLEKAHDSLVLVVPGNAPARLDHLHDACRQFDEVTLWPDAGVASLNNQQRKELEVAKTVIATAYTGATGNPPSNDQLVEILGMIRIVRVYTDEGGTDQNEALNILRTEVLLEPEQSNQAWNYLVVNILDAMKRGRGSDRDGLAASVSNQGFTLKYSSKAGRIHSTSIAIAENTQTIRELKATLRSPQDDAVLANHAKSELERLLKRTRQRANFLEGTEYQKEITAIANRCIDADLIRAPADLRFDAIVFAVRANAREKAGEPAARRLLEQAHQIHADGSTSLAEATILGLSDVDAAIVACRKLDTPQSRSQLFSFLATNKGVRVGLEWLRTATLRPADFNGIGVANICGSALSVGDVEFATEWIDGVSDEQMEEAPALLLLRAQLGIASTVPADHRLEIIQGLPQDLAAIVFAQTPAALAKRSAALRDLKHFRERIQDLNLSEISALADEYILWLEIIDQSTRENAKKQLAADLQNPKLVIERARLGIAFNVKFDREGLQAELTRRRNIGGWTAQEASTALQLEMTYGDYRKVADFIDTNRAELDKAQCFSPGQITGIEIEALARSGAVKSAQNRLKESEGTLPESVYTTLAKILEELSGQVDEVAAAKSRFDETGATDHLRAYCDILWRKSLFPALPEPAAELARRTQNSIDLVNALRVYNKLGRWREALALADSLPELAPDDESILLARAEAYFRTGKIGAARKILNERFKENSDPNVVHLDIFLSMESGEWGHIQGIIDRLRLATEKYTPIELARLSRLARDVGSAHWRELMDAALNNAGEDSNVFLAAYTLTTEEGNEDHAAAHQWLEKAIELSGEDGPVQRKSLQDIADMAPEWRKREDYVNSQVKAGSAPLFLAARSLNFTVTNASLGRGLGNLNTPDATKRSPILAFDGSHRAVDLSTSTALALDLSSLFTLSLIGLAGPAIEAFPRIVIGSGTLTLLFQERQRIKFHQPSRIARAKRLKALIDKGALKVLEPPSNLPGDLVKEVGGDLAAMLVKAREIGGIVIQPGPLHKVGSFMDTPADVGEFSSQISDTRQVLEFLKERGAISATVEKDATAYIHRVDAGMPSAQAINAEAPLFLDELAISYLQYTSTLAPLTQAVGFAFISKGTLQEIEGLLAYEEHADELLKHVDELSGLLAAGIKSEKVVINERNKPVDDDDDIRQSPSMALLQSSTAFDAIVVDDRALNYLPRWDVPAGAALVGTTIDLLIALESKGKIDPASHIEALRKLRVANFQLIPTSKSELIALLNDASTPTGQVIETQELIALRENLQSVAAGQNTLPREEPWVLSIRVPFLQAFRELWKNTSATAPAKAAWLLTALPRIADFAPRPLAPQVWINIRNQRAAEIAFLVNAMQVAPEHKEKFLDWVTATILDPLCGEDPELFDLVMGVVEKVITEVADGNLE